MADIIRNASAVWRGDLKRGTGSVSSDSGVLAEERYSFKTRFEQEPGTNPEELIAAAHAACYSMAFSGTLGEQGYRPESIETRASCTVSPKKGGGFEITRMALHVRGRVPGMDASTFDRLAHEADGGCPVSNLLRHGLTIELKATLLP